MAWTPSQDPWGIAMLASAAVFGIALVVVNARRMAVRPRTGPVAMTGAAVVAFLVCAAMGTLERVRQGPAEPAAATDESPTDEPPTDEPPTDAAAPDAVEAPIQAPGANEESDAAPTEGEPKDGSAAAGAKTPPARNSALEPTEAIPADDAERRAAIRTVLRTARSVYESQRDCKDAKAVGQAWAGVSSIPVGSRSTRVQAVVRRLEACRRQIRWAIAYTVRRGRVAARDDFEDTLKQRLQDAHGIKASVAITGEDHQRLRVASGSFDEAVVGTVVTESLKDELAELGFERIVLAAFKQSWRTPLQPRPDSGYAGDELAPYGLDAKLAFSPE